MKFGTTVLAVIAAFSATVLAQEPGSIAFVSQDNLDRIVVFAPQAGQQAIPTLTLPAGQTVSQTFPSTWIGNCHAVIAGQEDTGNGMLAEVSFNSWGGISFFDISAIVNASDVNNIKMMTPASSSEPSSGCQDLTSCTNLYRVWDDVATQSFQGSSFIVYVGNLAGPTHQTRRSPVRRSFVLGQGDAN